MSTHNCAPARAAVSRCERAIDQTMHKIADLKDDLLMNPDQAQAIKQKLATLYAELDQRKNELNNAEMELAACEGQNEHKGVSDRY